MQLKNKNIFLALVLLPLPLSGYIDPSTGSILIYFIIGLFASLLYSIQNIIFSIKSFFLRIFSKNPISQEKKNIVFYSEGGHYWECFRTVIEKLTDIKIKCSYYTSDKNDKGLKYKSDYCDVLFIGDGQFSMMSLNYLKAKILIMTTPQIEVMHLKRSKNVDYFIHIMHMPTDIFKIVPFAFDFFDCVMCSGKHQIDNIRLLEQTRALPPKKLLETGLTYFDGLIENKKNKEDVNIKAILLAPTWGKFGLLNKVGFDILDVLLKTGFNIIIRPNPQSFVSDIKVIQEIEEKSKRYKQIEIDRRSSPSYAMSQSDIMVGDMSGVIFDFAFVYEKPIIAFKNVAQTHSFVELNAINEYHNINREVWELKIMDRVATTISLDELEDLPSIIDKKISSYDNENIKKLRDKSVFNYGYAGDICAKQLIDLLKEFKDPVK